MVGTGFFSPFSACVTLQKGDTLDPDALLESTALLDASGQPIPGFQLSGVEGDPPLFLQFLSYVPVLPDQLHTLANWLLHRADSLDGFRVLNTQPEGMPSGFFVWETIRCRLDAFLWYAMHTSKEGFHCLKF